MKIVLNNQVITDSTSEYKKGDFFLLTTQNKKYYTNQNYITPYEILKDIKSKFIGITGTNGKTTTAFLIGYILKNLGFSVGVQGTEGFYLNGELKEKKTLTTPSIITTIDRVYKYQPDYFIMEVSSHAIIQNRIDGINFALKIFTNLSQDHLDYHKTMNEYQKAKELFFQDETLKIINKKYNLNINKRNAFYYPQNLKVNPKLIGEFNKENFEAAVLGVHKLTKIDLNKIIKIAENFSGIAGRMEEVVPKIIVDFAHTPDGMEKVLSAIKNKKIVVFGAGGDRDKTKRKIMGKVADKYANYIILTNDNPRCENPQEILKEIAKGIKNTPFEIIEDRKEAIKKAIALQKNEYVVILGKGDEKYMQFCNKKIPFSDREVVKLYTNLKLSTREQIF
jgi:UDP-N-acetylmuramoyl-L-alanyl-D-glutamate--2,6-diaminopimelate ligase